MKYAICVICGKRPNANFIPLYCYSETGDFVSNYDNYFIDVNKYYVLKPNHEKSFYEFCYDCINEYHYFPSKELLNLIKNTKDTINCQVSFLNKKIINNEQSMVLYITNLEQNLETKYKNMEEQIETKYTILEEKLQRYNSDTMAHINILNIRTFKTPILYLKKYKSVKSILIILLFLLLFWLVKK